MLILILIGCKDVPNSSSVDTITLLHASIGIPIAIIVNFLLFREQQITFELRTLFHVGMGSGVSDSAPVLAGGDPWENTCGCLRSGMLNNSPIQMVHTSS